MVVTRSQITKLLTVLIIVFFMIQACTTTNSSVATPTGVTATIIAPPPTEIQTSHTIEPLVTEPRLRFDSWSPDSQWIAYWIADGENTPSRLAFVNVQSGKVCRHNDVFADALESGRVLWAESGNVIAVQDQNGSALEGAPCSVFSPTTSIPISRTDSSMSPNGDYRADTTYNGGEGELQHYITTITEISTEQIVATVKWDASPHAWAESGWLNDELYLIGLDVKQGGLYITLPDGKIGNVVSDLLGLDIQDVGYISHLGRHIDAINGEYHLLIERPIKQSIGQPLLLYHSELDQVEELQFYRSWIVNGSNISTDGKWLFLSYPSSKQSDEITDFWIRAVDPSDSPASKLADEIGFAGFSDTAHKIIFTDDKYVYILNFPDGKTLGLWRSPGYYIDRVWWSPDGKHVAMQGFPVGSEPEAIFVITP